MVCLKTYLKKASHSRLKFERAVQTAKPLRLSDRPETCLAVTSMVELPRLTAMGLMSLALIGMLGRGVSFSTENNCALQLYRA